MNAFTVRETCDLSKFIISLSDEFFDNFPQFSCKQSYHVFAAKLLNFSYKEYLLYCATKGGELKGLDTFPYVIFSERAAALNICNKINKEWDRVSEFLKTLE